MRTNNQSLVWYSIVPGSCKHPIVYHPITMFSLSHSHSCFRVSRHHPKKVQNTNQGSKNFIMPKEKRMQTHRNVGAIEDTGGRSSKFKNNK